jgi:hypothetical protein
MKKRDWQLDRLDKKGGFNLNPVQTPELEPVARAFVDNVRMLEELKVFPFFSVGAAYNHGRTIGGAAVVASGSIAEIPADSEHYEVYRSAHASLHRCLPKDADIDVFYQKSTSLFATVAANAEAGVEAWLSAQIVSSWTAFETLAGDLWEAALNSHPHGLSELKGKNAPGEKTVQIGLLQKYSFDISNAMGTLLKETRTFDSLEDIRKNYALAFYTDDAKITEALSGNLLDTLSSVRNLLVHRGGVVDELYLRRTKSLLLAPKSDIGERIKLDGDIVEELSSAMKLLGASLVQAVDEWLIAHPVRSAYKPHDDAL